MAKRCKHDNAIYLHAGDSYVDHRSVVLWPECEQCRCTDCGAWLPLGPSNDSPMPVRIEMAAAARAVGDRVWRRYELHLACDEANCVGCAFEGLVSDINDQRASEAEGR